MAPRSRHRPPAPEGQATAAAGETREVEWQLAAPDLAVIQRWLDRHPVLDGLRLEPLPQQHIHDTYLDTQDWRVLRAGFALRIRAKGEQAEATLKGLRSARQDVADRREICEPLAKGTAEALLAACGPVASRVRDVAGVKPLRKLFEVRTGRLRFAVRSRRLGTMLGEIALDEARFSRANGHRRPLVLTRVEVEATVPDTTPLERLVHRLRTECELHPATENKFAVGLRSASLEPPRLPDPAEDAGESPPAIDFSIPAADFAAAALRQLLQAWQTLEPAARLGESPESLHALRVAGRRMDTLLGLFEAYLPAGLRTARPRLRSLLDALGRVRDFDIRLQRIGQCREHLPAEDRPALDPLLRHLDSQRAEARAVMLRALDTKASRRLLDTLPGLLVPTHARRASAHAALLAVAPDLIRARYRKLHRSAHQLTADLPLAGFHEVRVRTKKLRYALEILAPAYGKPAQEMLAALARLQSKLGKQHDAGLVVQYLRQLSTRPPPSFTPQTLFMLGRVAEAQTQEAAHLGARMERSWRKVRGRRWKALRAQMQALRDRQPPERREGAALHRSIRGAGHVAGATDA